MGQDMALGGPGVEGALSLWGLLGLGAPGETAWMVDALCAQTDPEVFFPGVGESVRLARSVCGVCPVRVACLAYALAHGEREGVWGGTSGNERRTLRRRIAGGVAA